MTEIIPGLQGSIPANSRKGFPYVGGKYVINDIKAVLKTILHFIIGCFKHTFYKIYPWGHVVWILMPNLLVFCPYKDGKIYI